MQIRELVSMRTDGRISMRSFLTNILEVLHL